MRQRNHLQQSAANCCGEMEDEASQAGVELLENQAEAIGQEIDKAADELLHGWEEIKTAYSGDELVYHGAGPGDPGAAVYHLPVPFENPQDFPAEIQRSG